MRRFIIEHRHKIIVLTASIIISLLFVRVVFAPVSKSEFLLIGDQFLRFSFAETYNNSFFILKSENFGIHNAWVFVVQFWDTIYFYVSYLLGLKLLEAEKLQFFTTVLVSLIFSYVGFYKLSEKYDRKIKYIPLGLISLWYVFNPYTLTLWHGGVYNIGLALTYSLAPLVFYYLNKILFDTYRRLDILLLVILIFLSSFVFWAFASVIFLLIVYTITRYCFEPRYLKRLLSRDVILLVLLTISSLSYILFSQVFEFSRLTGFGNPFTSPSFGNQQGGLWYQILMYFSWGIYTEWVPRTLYPFNKFFFTNEYIVATLSIYLLMLASIIKSLPRNKRLIVFLLITLLVSLFFAKAAQPPFGEIFMFLYTKVPFFGVFRSADARFGLAVVLVIALLLNTTKEKVSWKLYLPIMLFIILIQNKPVIQGYGIYGLNVDNRFYDRIISIPEQYVRISDIINSDKDHFYVLSDPPIVQGHILLNQDSHHIGQDMLSKLIEKPMVYISTNDTRLHSDAESLLSSIKRSKRYDKFWSLPIKYFLVRKDFVCQDCKYLDDIEMSKYFEKLYVGDSVILYKNPYYTSIFGDTVDGEYINPTRFYISNGGFDNQEFNFMLTYSDDWVLYKLNSKREAYYPDLYYMFKDEYSSQTHEKYSEYANRWQIDKGSFLVYYKPQIMYKFFLYLSITTIACVALLIIYTYINYRRK